MNDFWNKKDGILATTASVAATKILADSTLGVPKADADALKSAGDGLSHLVDDAKAKRDAAAAATMAKENGRVAAISALNHVGAILYGNPLVTDVQLQNLGYAPRRSGTPRPKAATTVAGLIAQPLPEDACLVTFRRGTNPKSTVFQIQVSLDSGATFSTVAAVTRTRLTIPLAAGVPAWVRVVASTGAGTATPSAAVAVYGPEAATVRLSLVEGRKAA